MPNKVTVEFADGTMEEILMPTEEEIAEYKKRLQPIVDFFNPDLVEVEEIEFLIPIEGDEEAE